MDYQKIKISLKTRTLFAWLLFSVNVMAATISGGPFLMGEEGEEADEEPAHQVSVSSFEMDSKEVTVSEYNSCVSRGACTPAHYDDGTCLMYTTGGFVKITVPAKFRTANYPVICVTWRQARNYCQSIGKDLPTEAQWEYGALAKSTNRYAYGNQSPTPSSCAVLSLGPLPTGSFSPNGFGLYDMTGNVWEWVRDRYQVNYYAQGVNSDPAGPQVGHYYVVRGGGWYSSAPQLRIKNRYWFDPDCAEASIGFRCAR